MEKEKDDAIVYREDWKFNRLRLLHVPTRELSTLYAKDAHVSMFAWNQYSTEIAYVLQETPYLNSPIYRGVKFEHVVISSKSSTQICTFPGLVGSLTWTGGKDPVYDLCFRAGFTPDKVNSSGALYFLSPKDRKYKLQMYGRHDDLDEIRSSMQGKVTVKVQTGLSDILKDLDGKNLFRSLDEEISSWDIAYDKKDNLVIALTRSTTSSPTEVYSVYLDEMVGLSQHGQSIAKLAIGDSQDLHTIAEDGTKLDSVFLRPAKAPRDQPLPTALLVHGGPYYRTNVRFDIPHYRWGPLLTAAGYAVLCPNYHGGSSHGDKYASYARGQMGTVDYTDVISLLKEGISLGWIDETRVVIAGWSQGGFISYLALTRPLLFRFKGSICGAGVTECMCTFSLLCSDDRLLIIATARGYDDNE